MFEIVDTVVVCKVDGDVMSKDVTDEVVAAVVVVEVIGDDSVGMVDVPKEIVDEIVVDMGGDDWPLDIEVDVEEASVEDDALDCAEVGVVITVCDVEVIGAAEVLTVDVMASFSASVVDSDVIDMLNDVLGDIVVDDNDKLGSTEVVDIVVVGMAAVVGVSKSEVDVVLCVPIA